MPMDNFNGLGFHTQIASIMEMLANAAVAEICTLVDNDYAVFRLEITQSQKENRALRRKLQLFELKMARERVLASRPNSVKILDRYRGMARGTFCRRRGLSPRSCLHIAQCLLPGSPLHMCSDVLTRIWSWVSFWTVCNNSPDYYTT